MTLLAQIVGLLAVATFLLSYQQKKRQNIIVWNATSRVLYIIQYLLLGALEGAVLDVLGTISSVAAQNKYRFKNHLKFVVLGVNLVIVAVGLIFYKNIFSIFPIVGVVLHTSAFWLDKERTIRIVSFLGSPFWLVYNLVSAAYGSALGDVFTMVSIGIAICRYDLFPKKEEAE